MNAGSTPMTELRSLDTSPAGETFWRELHEHLIAVALDVGTEEAGSPLAARPVTPLAPRPASSRRRPAAVVVAVAAAAVVALVVGIAIIGDGRSTDRAPGDVAAPDPTDGVRRTDPDAAVPATTTRPAPPTATAALSRTLTEGASGGDVRMVQQRLADLRFDPGPVDGVFGAYTTQAVWAFETLVIGTPRQDVTGAVTPEAWAVMQSDVTIAPRRTNLTSTHVEIYLPEQALVVFRDNLPALIAHISSGELAEAGADDFTKGKEWCEEVTIAPGELGNEEGTEAITDGRCGNSMTPGGTYRAYRKVQGRRQTALGGMYDPVFFNYGIAVHGSDNVPSEPASHGGIRINRWLAPRFQSMITTLGNQTGDQIWVWDGMMEPESYGAKPGHFDWPWLEWREAHADEPFVRD